MAIDLLAQWADQLGEARFVSTAKRILASRNGQPVCDSTRALLVWPPRRVVPDYAVPRTDLPGGIPEPAVDLSDLGLPDHVLLPFTEFDWLEEDESVIGHPHDPLSRIDILHSTRHVTVELDGVTLADSHRPVALFETGLPPRWYVPAHEVRTDLLVASDKRTTCAYKGHASYLSAPDAADGADIAWVYRQPLREAEPMRDLICFWAERTTTLVDGVREPGFVPPPGFVAPAS